MIAGSHIILTTCESNSIRNDKIINKIVQKKGKIE
jgi:hypothetical protein